jgi:hypothetical protein
MSLVHFQHAFADVVASAATYARAFEDADEFLAKYSLSDRERGRLKDMICQQGMQTCCMLHRANRLSAINSQLSLVCFLLGDRLRDELQLFWAENPSTDLQFTTEALGFGAFLRRRLDNQAIVDPLLEEILEFELAVTELRLARSTENGQAASSRARVVRFRHDPAPLLKLVLSMQPPPYDVQEGDFGLLVASRAGQIELSPIAGELARLLESADNPS